MGTVICAVDESGASRAALEVAAQLATTMGVKVVVAHVDQSDPDRLAEDAVQARTSAARRIAVELAAGAGLAERGHAVGAVGDVAETITRLASVHDASFVVVGASVRGRARQTLRSRTAQRLSQLTDVPVLLAAERHGPVAASTSTAGDDRAPADEPAARRRTRARRSSRAWSARPGSLRPRPSRP